MSERMKIQFKQWVGGVFIVAIALTMTALVALPLVSFSDGDSSSRFGSGQVQRWVNQMTQTIAEAGVPLPSFKTAPRQPSAPPVIQPGTQQHPYYFVKPKDIINADLIRVGISSNDMMDQEYPTTILSSTKPMTLVNMATGAAIQSGVPAWKAVTVSKTSRGFWLKRDGKMITGSPFTGPVQFRPESADGKMRINNITRKGKMPTYRGVIEVTGASSSPAKLSVVNVLPLHDYLKAVVPNELPARYGLEAVKAQAVAARNYALKPRNKVWPQFDICDSQYCQAYYGAHTETPDTNRALQETDGLVGLYQGDLILALYSSAHGGYGESYANAFSDPVTKQFPAPALPYLPGGPDIPDPRFRDLSSEQAARAFWTNKIPSYDVKSSYHRWEKTWNKANIQTTLNRGLFAVSKDNLTKDFVSPHFRQGNSVGTLKRVNVKRRGVSGKAMEIEVIGTGGRWTIKKEFVIRKVFKYNGRMLPSANVVFSHLTDPAGNLVALKANGGGFGHGVGMSQLGASWMSGRGYKFNDIIQHYYKGVSIGSVPLKIGGAKGSKMPIRNSFYARDSRGTLMIEVTGQVPDVQLAINDKPLDVQMNGHRVIRWPAQAFLKAGRHNTITLYPKSGLTGTIKVWIEMTPPKAVTVPIASQS